MRRSFIAILRMAAATFVTGVDVLICLQQRCSLVTSTSPLSLTTVNQGSLFLQAYRLTQSLSDRSTRIGWANKLASLLANSEK